MTLETPIFLQAGSYPARALRRLTEATLHLGVVNEGDLKVTQRGAGANMTVDVAAGLVVVPAASGSNGRYLCANTATVSLSIGAAPGAGDGRIDIVIAEVRDAQYAGADNDWQLLVVAGTADPSPTTPAVPAGAVALAAVTVTDATTSIVDAAIFDGRSYARPVVSTDRDPAYLTGPDGQIIVREVASAPDRVFVRSSGAAVELVPLTSMQFELEDSLPIQNLTGTLAVWDAPIEVDAPGPGAYKVNVLHYGIVSSTREISSGITVSRFLEISTDGGATWPHQSVDFGGVTTTLYCPFEKRITDPTGAIQARVMVRDGGGGGTAGQAAAGGTLSLTVTPVS